MKIIYLFSILQIVIISCQNQQTGKAGVAVENDKDYLNSYSEMTDTATLAGGCFWCVEQPLEGIDGILSVVSGFAGGEKPNPTYDEVSKGKTKHRESVQVVFDPKVISYAEVLRVYWKQFDPTDEGGSFADRGFQYSSTIFYHTPEQKNVAEESKKELENSNIFDDPVITPIIAFTNFYPAEDYHQDYYKKNPEDYRSYKKASGRKDFIVEKWEKPDEEEYPVPSEQEIKEMLSDLQYEVTRENGTEKAFDNEFWDNKKAGIYVDIISGEPLFSSESKFASGTGWPSFTQPLDPRFVNKVLDSSMGMKRVEVRGKIADSHLGHIFHDGPEPLNLRYCLNSAAFNFIPKEEMEEKGYGHYLWLVE